jgi:hypothetical protein
VLVLFALSVLLVIYMLVANILFAVNNTLTIITWALSVPLAAILAGAGAALAAGMPRGRLWLMVSILVVAVGTPFTAGIFLAVIPLDMATRFPPLVFGVGGVLIITLVLLTCWFWAQERPKLHPAQRLPADLRLLAYVLFGIAAWFTCGVASSIVAFGGRLQDWTMVQTSIYSIMTELVLGWGFLFASLILASGAGGSGEVERGASKISR